LDERFGPLLGESVWHAITVDRTLQEVSEQHLRAVHDALTRHGRHLPAAPQILEVAAYAHTTGYALAQRVGAHSTLLDISASTLKLGGQTARRQGLSAERTRLVAADFHALPFDDGQFHFVYICSALHHTWNWKKVLAELIRVLAPGGLLLLENEPCQREFCFYGFRTNRTDRFTPFETKLDQLGVLRTVAEPYLGSRPETLFGMVENQTIPLNDLKAAVEASCALLEFSVTPEVCMGPLEREMIERRTMQATELAAWLSSRLNGLLSQAATALGEVETGLGFSLPDEQRVAALCDRVSGLLKSLPVPPAPAATQRLVASTLRLAARAIRKLLRQLPPLGATANGLARSRIAIALRTGASPAVDPYREALARLFGASTRIVARKHGASTVRPEGRLNAVYPEQEGVVLGLEPDMLRLLRQIGHSSLDLQSSPEEVVRSVFPPEDWEWANDPPRQADHAATPQKQREEGSDRAIRSLVCRSGSGKIRFPHLRDRSLILLRCHGAYRGQPYRVLLLHGGEELARMDVHQSESFLLAGITRPGQSSGGGILLKLVALDGGAAPFRMHLSLSYAGAVELQASDLLREQDRPDASCAKSVA
jgi:ubiquinone/menaquinone biosynthesis C-methylase UbiE